MLALRGMLPAGAQWAAFGISRHEFPMVAQAALLGGHVRVGLEDNLYLEKGVFGTNAQLVEKAGRILNELGALVMTPKQAREALGLRAVALYQTGARDMTTTEAVRDRILTPIPATAEALEGYGWVMGQPAGRQRDKIDFYGKEVSVSHPRPTSAPTTTPA